MSSSGLIYAVIVGAWAVYLVPMWLRRQDELNERRDRERFTTAIRLLGRKPAMERWYAEVASTAAGRSGTAPPAAPQGAGRSAAADGVPASDGHHAAEDGADAAAAVMAPPDTRWSTRITGIGTVRRLARRGRIAAPGVPQDVHGDVHDDAGPGTLRRRAAARAREAERRHRQTVLARRRRVVSVLFACFTFGVIATPTLGVGWLTLAAASGLLLSVYIPYLRMQERRRYVQRMRRREALARAAAHRAAAATPGRPSTPAAAPPAPPAPSPHDDARSMQAQWLADLDASRHGSAHPASRGPSWEPVAVPRPTYADAPAAHHSAPSVDLDDVARHDAPPRSDPVFDQYAADDHYRRAAGE